MSSESEVAGSVPKDDVEANTSTKMKHHKSVCKEEEESELQKLNNILIEEGIKMKSLLSSPGSVPKFSKENLMKNCIKWMTICCNVEEYYEFPVALNNLMLLIKHSAEHRELNGPVTYFLKTKFFAKFFRYYITMEEGWQCVELCAKHYKSSCGVYHDRLKEAAASLFEKKIVSKAVARAYALLPMTGESGSDGILHSNKWNMQFEEVAKKCYNILRDLLKDINDAPNIGDTLPEDRYCSVETIDEELLYILFCNYCNVLRFMLLCAFPATKTLVPQQIFNIVCRCLNVSRTAAGTPDTTRKMKLSERLPKFHIVAHSLLKALIMTCRTHLLPFSFLITKLIYQTIQLTDVNITTECNEMSLMLRITAYDNWTKWVTVSNGAGAVLCSDLAVSALQDLSYPTLSEKMEDDCESFDRNRGDPDIIIRTHTLRKTLGLTALNVLTVYTRVNGGNMTVEQLKDIHMFTIDSILRIHHSAVLEFPFSETKYRLALYSLLMELVNTRSTGLGSPVSWALELFRQGVYDPDCKVSNFCSSALPNVQNIIDQDVIRAIP